MTRLQRFLLTCARPLLRPLCRWGLHTLTARLTWIGEKRATGQRAMSRGEECLVCRQVRFSSNDWQWEERSRAVRHLECRLEGLPL